MKSLYLYFKLLFSDDEQLIAKWNQLSDGKVSGRYREAVAKELKKESIITMVLIGLNLPLEVERISYPFHKSGKR